MVLVRVQLLKSTGVAAMSFGKIDKSDFLIPPFALFYFYLIFARAFHWPAIRMTNFYKHPGCRGSACCRAQLRCS
jgi:hypothetical protein